MLPIPLRNLNESPKISPVFRKSNSDLIRVSTLKSLKNIQGMNSKEPAFYTGSFVVEKVTDTYMSFTGWGKGVAFVNDFNIGRYWPSFGPQCNLYLPDPILRSGKYACPSIFHMWPQERGINKGPTMAYKGPKYAGLISMENLLQEEYDELMDRLMVCGPGFFEVYVIWGMDSKDIVH